LGYICNWGSVLRRRFFLKSARRGFAYGGLGRQNAAFFIGAVALSVASAQAARADNLQDCVQTANLDAAVKACTALIADKKLTALHPLAYGKRAMAFSLQRKFDLSIADFNRIIALKPGDYRAYYDRANAYSGKGDSNRAYAGYTRTIELNPKNSQKPTWPVETFLLRQAATTRRLRILTAP
jgi:tetratricopeptide (TPR) repeat protein